MVKALTERSYGYIVLITLIIFLALGAASSILQNLFGNRMAQGYLMEYCLSTEAVHYDEKRGAESAWGISLDLPKKALKGENQSHEYEKDCAV